MSSQYPSIPDEVVVMDPGPVVVVEPGPVVVVAPGPVELVDVDAPPVPELLDDEDTVLPPGSTHSPSRQTNDPSQSVSCSQPGLAARPEVELEHATQAAATAARPMPIRTNFIAKPQLPRNQAASEAM